MELAVRGKLLEQGPQDEPVHRLLERVGHEAEQLQKNGRIRINKHLTKVSESERPFDIPSSWNWIRMGQLAWSQAGFAFKSTRFNEHAKGMPLIRIRDIFRSSTEAFYDGEFREEFLVRPGDQLVGMDGLFKVAKWNGPTALLNQRVSRLIYFSVELVQPFFGYALQRHLDSLHGSKAYTTVQHLSGKQIETSPIPVPPIEEQRRIVGRVDELMALLDRLEAKRQEREDARTASRDSALAALREAPTPDDVETAWLRIQDRFGEFFNNPETLSPLRQAIKDLAIKGLLLPQYLGDQGAVEVLASIRSEKLKSKVTMNKGGSSLPISNCDSPFPLPPTWRCLVAEDLCRPSNTITYGVLKPVWVKVGVPTVRVQDMQRGEIVLTGIGQCSSERAEKFLKTRLEAGDLLIAKDGATLGKTAFVPASLEGGNITQHVLRFPISRQVNSHFIRLVVDSPHGQAWMKAETKGVALPGVNVGDFRRMPIPIPSLPEQNRIVEKVDQLISMVDRLYEGLSAELELQAPFASASTHHLEL